MEVLGFINIQNVGGGISYYNSEASVRIG